MLRFFALWESLGGCLELFGYVFFYIFLQNGFFSVFFGEVKEVVVRDHFINTVQDFPRSSQLSIKGFLLRCN